MSKHYVIYSPNDKQSPWNRYTFLTEILVFTIVVSILLIAIALCIYGLGYDKGYHDSH